MDQVRMVLGWLKRHHFWVLCVIVAAIALASWYRAANALEEERVRNQSTIKSAFDAQNGLRSEEFHANENINAEQTQQIKTQGESVKEAWSRLYNRQREEVLKWPTELSERFRNYVAKLKFGEEIPVDLRNHYMNYVGTHFKKLPEKVGARILEDSEGRSGSRGIRSAGSLRSSRSGRGGEGVQVEQEDYIVEWLDQMDVRDELDMPREPSSIRIWITQEDLWVYHTLLQIIANTNEAAGADRYSNAAVREIIELDVGRDAARAAQGGSRIMMVAPLSSGGDMDVSGGRVTMPSVDDGGRSDSLGRAGEGGAMSEEEEAAALKAGRYLDAQGNPTSEPGVEYKRLPVRMTLLMDQRWLTHLIAECASAPLQVEVQEVRINPSSINTSGGGYDSRSGGMMGGGSFRSGESRGEGIEFPQEPNMVPVVIQGVIYIFNEPNESLFQVSGDQA